MKKFSLVVMCEKDLENGFELELLINLSEFLNTAFLSTTVSDDLFVVGFDTEKTKQELTEFLDQAVADPLYSYHLLDHEGDSLAYRTHASETRERTIDIQGKKNGEIVREINQIKRRSKTKPIFRVAQTATSAVTESTVDALLEKIRQSGMASLTESELEILHQRSQQVR